MRTGVECITDDPDIGEQSRVVEQVAGLWEQGTPPGQWGDRLRRIFAQACWP